MQPAASRIVDAKEHGDETRIEACVMEALVQKSKHARRIAVAIDDDFANRANGQRTVKRCRGAFAGNVA